MWGLASYRAVDCVAGRPHAAGQARDRGLRLRLLCQAYAATGPLFPTSKLHYGRCSRAYHVRARSRQTQRSNKGLDARDYHMLNLADESHHCHAKSDGPGHAGVTAVEG